VRVNVCVKANIYMIYFALPKSLLGVGRSLARLPPFYRVSPVG
jgi:hypothetical protein